jgi:hypothetical protein
MKVSEKAAPLVNNGLSGVIRLVVNETMKQPPQPPLNCLCSTSSVETKPLKSQSVPRDNPRQFPGRQQMRNISSKTSISNKKFSSVSIHICKCRINSKTWRGSVINYLRGVPKATSVLSHCPVVVGNGDTVSLASFSSIDRKVAIIERIHEARMVFWKKCVLSVTAVFS